MDQSDIFRLLLIVLLVANSQLSPSQNSTDTENPDFNYTSINDILILAMFIKLFASPTAEEETNTTF